jgi:hypothetical protein
MATKCFIVQTSGTRWHVTVSDFHPSLIFANKARSLPLGSILKPVCLLLSVASILVKYLQWNTFRVQPFTGLHTQGSLLALAANIRQGWK